MVMGNGVHQLFSCCFVFSKNTIHTGLEQLRVRRWC